MQSSFETPEKPTSDNPRTPEYPGCLEGQRLLSPLETADQSQITAQLKQQLDSLQSDMAVLGLENEGLTRERDQLRGDLESTNRLLKNLQEELITKNKENVGLRVELGEVKARARGERRASQDTSAQSTTIIGETIAKVASEHKNALTEITLNFDKELEELKTKNNLLKNENQALIKKAQEAADARRLAQAAIDTYFEYAEKICEAHGEMKMCKDYKDYVKRQIQHQLVKEAQEPEFVFKRALCVPVLKALLFAGIAAVLFVGCWQLYSGAWIPPITALAQYLLQDFLVALGALSAVESFRTLFNDKPKIALSAAGCAILPMNPSIIKP